MSQMSQGTTEELKDELRRSFRLLKTLRDEVRVDLHLASMDAKDRWEREIEPQLERAELAAQQAKRGTRKLLQDLIDIVQDFKRSLPARH